MATSTNPTTPAPMTASMSTTPTTSTSSSSSAMVSQLTAETPATITTSGSGALPPSTDATATHRHISPATKPITVSNVADIFNAAGYAFKKLSELIQLVDNTPIVADNGTSYQTHWDAEDVAKFQQTLHTFNEDLNKLTVNLKNKMAARLIKEHTDKLAAAAAATAATAASSETPVSCSLTSTPTH